MNFCCFYIRCRGTIKKDNPFLDCLNKKDIGSKRFKIY